jgi:hypothetical protein
MHAPMDNEKGNGKKESPCKEYGETQIRKFMTVFFIQRARRHLKTLSDMYGWSPDVFKEYEERFIKYPAHVPLWKPDYEK